MTDTKPISDKQKSKLAGKKVAKKTATKKNVSTRSNKPTKDMPNNSPEVKQSKTSSGSSFAILLSLLALLGSGFTWYQTQVAQVQSDSSVVKGITEIGGKVERIADSVQTLKSQQSTVVSKAQLETEILKSSTALNEQLRDMGDEQKQLNESLAKINQDLQKGVNAYVLDEVSQLLKLANHNTVFLNDPAAAIKALQLADAQLKGQDDPRFSAVRSKINEEITALQTLPKLDLEKAVTSLNSIAANVEKLPLANEPEQRQVENKDESNNPAKAAKKSWRGELSTLWKEVKSSVNVQRVDQPPKPLLVPEQRYFLNQNLQLSLNAAQLALLQQRQSVFEQNIASSIKWLNDYFDLKDQRVSKAVAQLKELQKLQLKQNMPDITGSYQALQSVKAGVQ